MSASPAITMNPQYAGMPTRYHIPWRTPFDERIERELRPGIRILDLGSGRTPAISRSRLPEGVVYAGLDLSESELRKAPEGSYDEMHVADINSRLPELEGQFDLIVSWQVLEHVKSLDEALDNVCAYLKPGGCLIAQFSGTFSVFGLINRVIPQRVGVGLMRVLLKRNPETVFPAYYHHCWYGAIDRAMKNWSQVDIVSRYEAARYFNFSPPLRSVYARVEDWMIKGNYRNLATHYLIDARR
ncbi:MAG: class I SAM-dependent methyltransferase [Dehalococcoidia bacterium]